MFVFSALGKVDTLGGWGALRDLGRWMCFVVISFYAKRSYYLCKLVLSTLEY